MSPTSDKVAAIIEASPPQSASEVRSLLGMTQYLARFIPNYSDTVAPLRELTHKNVQFKWTNTHQHAFEQLKQAMGNAETVQYFSTDLKTEIIVDASPIGIAGILTQKDHNNEVRVIEYASRSLTETEKRYSQTEREALAVVWSCEHYNLYVYGSTFTVVSDHKPLLGIMNSLCQSQQQG